MSRFSEVCNEASNTDDQLNSNDSEKTSSFNQTTAAATNNSIEDQHDVSKAMDVILTSEERHQLSEAFKSDDFKRTLEVLGDQVVEPPQDMNDEQVEIDINREMKDEVSVQHIGGRVCESRVEHYAHLTGAMKQMIWTPSEENRTTDQLQVSGRDLQALVNPHSNFTLQAHLHMHKTVTNVKVENSSAVSVGGNVTVNTGEAKQEAPRQTLTKVTPIRDATWKDLQKWTEGMVHTKAVSTLVDELSKGPSVYVVKGNPGEGKTTVAKMALKTLQDMGREVFIVNTPDEYFTVKSVKRSIILLNDIFGSSHFSLSNLSRWESVLDDHLALEEHKGKDKQKSTILLVSRSHVLESSSIHLGKFHSLILKEDCVMDLTKFLKYRVEDKVEIWSYYARQHRVEIEESAVREICRMDLPHGFPHCCRLFSRMLLENPKLKMKHFFLKPLEFLQLELRPLFRDGIIGPLMRDMLQNYGEHVLDASKASSEDLFQFKQAISQYEGIYLRRNENLITFHHPSVYDTVAFIACEMDPLFVIQKCSMTFLNDRVRIEGILVSDVPHQKTVAINRTHRQNFLNRLKEEVISGNISDVLCHDSFHDEHFVREFMGKLLFYKRNQTFWTWRTFMDRVFSRENDSQHLHDLIQQRDETTGESFLYFCSKSKSTKILQYVCDRIILSKEDQKSALFGICKHGSEAAIQYFLRKFPKIDISVRNTKRETLLIVAAKNPCDYILRTLINRGVSVQAEDALGKTALHYICRNGMETDASIIKLMMTNESERQTDNPNQKAPLVAACSHGHNTVVTALLEGGADISESDVQGNTSLTAACWQGHNTIVKTLLEREAEINENDKDGFSPLTAACIMGYNAVVTSLLDEGADVNKSDSDGNTPLNTACMSGQNDVVKTLLNRGADINKIDKNGNTPLAAACVGGDNGVVRTILGRGADINNDEGTAPLTAACRSGNSTVVATILDRGADIDKDDKANTPLTAACGVGTDSVVTFLLDRGADINKSHEKGFSPLTAACLNGHNPIITTLLNRGVDINTPDNLGYTPLTAAIRYDHNTVVTNLLDRGATFDEADKNGYTPLTFACWNGHSAIVTTLLDRGANINVADNNGYTPLTLASWNGGNTVVTTLLDRGADINASTNSCYTPLTAACWSYDKSVITTLLDRGADIDEPDEEGNTPLTSACWKGYYAIVRILLNRGAAMHKTDEEGKTPLMAACWGGDKHVVTTLLDRGADINTSDKAGNTPITTASRRGHNTVVAMLLDRGADIDKADKEGNTPLTAACWYGADHVVRTLLDREVNVNKDDEEGSTPLTAACWSSHRAVVNTLLDSGADIDIVDEEGNTPLTAACWYGEKTIVETLLDRGADINIEDKEGNTPLAAASWCGDNTLVKLLLDRGADQTKLTRQEIHH